jgi:hypothetical protein
MNDLELQQRLRTWYRQDVGDEHAPDRLYGSLAGVTETYQPAGLFGRRAVLLLAAILLLAAALAVAVGSGLIRLPRLSDSSLVPIVGRCDDPMPDGIVLAVDGTWRDPTLSQKLVVYADGRVVSGPWIRNQAELAVFESRRLAPDGVRSLLEAVGGTGLGDCHAVRAAGVDHNEISFNVSARLNGNVTRFRIGPGNLSTGQASPTSEAAAAALVSRLSQLDLVLPASAWVDGVWIDAPIDRYAVWAHYLPFDYGEGVVGPFGGWDATLPDGSTVRTFGDQFPETGEEVAGSVSRCAVVSAEAAEAMLETLAEWGELGQQDGIRTLRFMDRGQVQVEPAFVTEMGCDDVFRDRLISLPSTPENTLAPELTEIDNCAFVPDGLMPGDLENERSDADWTQCTTREVDENTSGVTVYARRQPTASDDALRLAQLDFGEGGFTTREMGDAVVYTNDCVRVRTVCQPAMAIFQEPYYVVVAAFPQSEGDIPRASDYERLELWLRHVTEGIIDALSELRASPGTRSI